MGGRKGVKGLTTNMCGIVMSEATVSSRELLSKARQDTEMLEHICFIDVTNRWDQVHTGRSPALREDVYALPGQTSDQIHLSTLALRPSR